MSELVLLLDRVIVSSLVVKFETWFLNADTWSDKVASFSGASFSVASIIGNVIRLVSWFTWFG